MELKITHIDPNYVIYYYLIIVEFKFFKIKNTSCFAIINIYNFFQNLFSYQYIFIV